MVKPTDYHVFEHVHYLPLPLTITMEEGVFDAASELPRATLIDASQLKVGKAILEVILLAVLGAPEGKLVGVDSIVGSVAN